MQGLNEQKFPPGRMQAAADGTTFHGPGRSRNTASARPCSSCKSGQHISANDEPDYLTTTDIIPDHNQGAGMCYTKALAGPGALRQP
jgi:hypothetical protein